MTPEQVAAFTISNDYYMWSGVILGLILGGSFKFALNIFANRFERPRRIKFRHLQGREERKDNFEYLYLYRGDYYTLEQRDFLQKEHFKKIKATTPFDLKFFFVFVLVVVTMTVFFIKSVDLGI